MVGWLRRHPKNAYFLVVVIAFVMVNQVFYVVTLPQFYGPISAQRPFSAQSYLEFMVAYAIAPPAAQAIIAWLGIPLFTRQTPQELPSFSPLEMTIMRVVFSILGIGGVLSYTVYIIYCMSVAEHLMSWHDGVPRILMIAVLIASPLLNSKLQARRQVAEHL